MSTFSPLPQIAFDLIGIAGFIFYMLAYGLLQLGRISGQSYCYTIMNMAAASLVLISLVNQFNLASLLIQLAWIAISVLGLYRIRSARTSRTSKANAHKRTHSYFRTRVQA